MKFIDINSTNISGAYHDGKDMYLRFVKGPVYIYKDVPKEVYANLIEAESVGQFFHHNIRGQFSDKRIKD